MGKELYIISKHISDELQRKSIESLETNSSEICAMLYHNNNVIDNYVPIKNISEKKGSYQYDIDEFNRHFVKNSLFFHSHPISEFLSTNDVLNSLDSGSDTMIFSCQMQRFYLYSFQDCNKEQIMDFKNNDDAFEDFQFEHRQKVYQETGINEIDAAIRSGVFENNFFKKFGNIYNNYLKSCQEINNNESPRDNIRLENEIILENLYEGISYYYNIYDEDNASVSQYKEGDLTHNYFYSSYQLFNGYFDYLFDKSKIEKSLYEEVD